MIPGRDTEAAAGEEGPGAEGGQREGGVIRRGNSTERVGHMFQSTYFHENFDAVHPSVCDCLAYRDWIPGS